MSKIHNNEMHILMYSFIKYKRKVMASLKSIPELQLEVSKNVFWSSWELLLYESPFWFQMVRMDYTEVNIEQRFHRHLIGKNGSNSECVVTRTHTHTTVTHAHSPSALPLSQQTTIRPWCPFFSTFSSSCSLLPLSSPQ